MRVFNRVLLVVAGVLVVAVAALLVFVWTFDANAYRQEIASAVEQQTGRQFRIDGDMALTVYPWLGLSMDNVRLGNAKGFGDRPMASIEHVHLAVKLLPLFSRKVELDSVTLTGLHLLLQRSAGGRTNWQDLTAQAGTSRAHVVPVASTRQQAAAVPDWLRQAYLGGFYLHKAEIVWQDAASGRNIRVYGLNLMADDIALGRSVPVTVAGEADMGNGLKLDYEGGTRVNVATDLATAQAKSLHLECTAIGPVPGHSQTVTLDGGVDANLKGGSTRLQPLHIKWGPVNADGQLSVDTAQGAPRAQGKLDVASFDPRELFNTLDREPPDTRDNDVLTSASMSTGIAFADGKLALNDLKAKLDDSTLQGRVVVNDFSLPDVAFNLHLDKLDLDRYLPPESEGGGTPTPASPGEAAAASATAAFSPLKKLRLDGNFRADQLTATRVPLQDLRATMRARDGQLRIHPLQAQVYGGQYDGDVRVDATGDQPVFHLDEKLKGIQAEPLLKAFTGKDVIRGLGSVAVNLQARGADTQAWLKTAVGKADFSFQDGAVKGLDLAARLRAAMQSLKGKSVQNVEQAETDFTELKGTLNIDDGIVRNQDLSAKSPLFRVSGDGKANLREQTVDYLLTVNLVGTLKGQGGESLDELKHLPIPVRFKGKLLDPGISLDLKEAISAQQRQKLEKKQEKLKHDLQDQRDEEADKAKHKLQNKLKDLLKQ